MRARWKSLALVAALLAVAPVARAHELQCEKTVNGTTFLDLDTFPAQLTYDLTVQNIHPTSPSEALVASDPMFDQPGNPLFDVPFTLPLGASTTKEVNIDVKDFEACIALAHADGTIDDFIDNVFTVQWDSGTSVCSARVHCINPDVQPPPGEDTRRMTGGGSIGTGKDRVTHGFTLHCDPTVLPNNLEVNFGGNHFHLTSLTTATCTDDPAISEGNPVAGFDTITGTGTGDFNNVPGATVSFIFTDAGEPGDHDRARIVVHDAANNLVLSVDGTLTFGNQQAHP